MAAPVKYSVPIIAHFGGEDLCFWDSITMVANYKKLRQMTRSPFRLAPEPWESLLDAETQRRITLRGQGIFHTGESARDVMKVANERGFQRQDIAITPAAVEKALADNGPFVYIGRLKTPGLMGQPRHHSLVVTGIEEVGNQYFIFYNDPRLKRPQREEFYGFLLKYMPFLLDPKNATKAVDSTIFHLEEESSSTYPPTQHALILKGAHVRPFNQHSSTVGPSGVHSILAPYAGQQAGGQAVTRSRPFDWRSNAIPPKVLQRVVQPDQPGQPGWGMELNRSPSFDWHDNAIPPAQMQLVFHREQPGQPGWGQEVIRSPSFDWNDNAIPPPELQRNFRADQPGQTGWGQEVTLSRPFDWRSNAIPPPVLQPVFQPDLPGQPGWGQELTLSRPFDWRGNAIPPASLQPVFQPDRPGQPGWGMEFGLTPPRKP